MYARLFALLPAMLLVGLIAGCAEPPQLDGDAQSLKATDALLTAISARDVKLLDQCEKNLAAKKASGNLSQPAYEHLQGIIDDGRADRWDAARKRLKKFIRAQRPTPKGPASKA